MKDMYKPGGYSDPGANTKYDIAQRAKRSASQPTTRERFTMTIPTYDLLAPQFDISFLNQQRSLGAISDKEPWPDLQSKTWPGMATAPEVVQSRGALVQDVSARSINDRNEKTTNVTAVESFAKLFRQSRRLTDEILIKRTQWLQELDRLAHSRNFLMNSTIEMMSMVQHSFDITSSLPRDQERLRRRTERMPAILSEPRRSPGEETSTSTTPHSTDSIEANAYTTSESEVGSSGTGDRHRQAATKVYDQYCEDYNTVMKLEWAVKILTNELSNLEYRLQLKEEEIRERMFADNIASALRSEMLAHGPEMSDSSEPAQSSSTIPSLVRQYFDRQGDVNIWRERLVELDYTHEEAKVDREFLRDRGDEIDPPDEEFESSWADRRQHIQSGLEKAQKEATALKKECNDAGLKTERYHASDMRFEELPIQVVRSEFGRDRSPFPVQAMQMPPPAPHSVEVRISQRIDEWLREVPVTFESGGPEQVESIIEQAGYEEPGDMPMI